jgi:tetratricopeptide (TPR) repeat protein
MVYERARTEFPWAPRIVNGLAQVRKEMGDLRGALQMYDENIRRFPYDLISRSGRADVLKHLHEYTAALAAYDDIIHRWPERLGARHSKAAVFVLLGRFDEAEALLPSSPPESLDEWIAYHVRGMILLRKERISDAIAHFESGLRTLPYARERDYFQNALAVAYLHQERYDRIEELIPQPNEPISNVLLLHASAATGQTARASRILNVVERSGVAEVIELGKEIARRFRLSNETPRHDKGWIFRTECQAVLLAAA